MLIVVAMFIGKAVPGNSFITSHNSAFFIPYSLNSHYWITGLALHSPLIFKS